jgi:hypothetical protein
VGTREKWGDSCKWAERRTASLDATLVLNVSSIQDGDADKRELMISRVDDGCETR